MSNMQTAWCFTTKLWIIKIIKHMHVGVDSCVCRHTSMTTGTTSLLSVIRVTTVSVNVLFVIVSVTRPGPVGGGGSSIGSGFLTVTVTAWTGGSQWLLWLLLGVLLLRKWAGIIAWNSSLVIGFGSTCSSPPAAAAASPVGCGDADSLFLWFCSVFVGLFGCVPFCGWLIIAVGLVTIDCLADEESLVFDMEFTTRRGAGCGNSGLIGLLIPFVFGTGDSFGCETVSGST